jgi:hypothetical protein
MFLCTKKKHHGIIDNFTLVAFKFTLFLQLFRINKHDAITSIWSKIYDLTILLKSSENDIITPSENYMNMQQTELCCLIISICVKHSFCKWQCISSNIHCIYYMHESSKNSC